MPETADFLLEIGTEELPPNALPELRDALSQHLIILLAKAGLPHGEVTAFATPRRVAIIVQQLAVKQSDRTVEQRGPSVTAAFDAAGKPTEACRGFAKSCNVTIDDLAQKTDEKGSWLVFNSTKKGKTSQELLPEIVAQALKKMPIPRMMRWGQGDASFVRPVHWILMLHGNEVIPATIMNIASGNKTYGHRFHHPEAITISAPDQYEDALKKQGYVIADFDKRRALIKKNVLEIATKIGTPLIEENLLDETTSLTEWPVALLGEFDQRFLKLPPEVLLLSLQKQQRCFPILDKDGKLLPYFITISNIESKQPESVIQGNENVIRARLTDAEFFYRTDMQFPLSSYLERLKKTVFQTDLGNVYDRTLRLADLAGDIANKIGADVVDTRRAAALSKADLMTTMVGEFPELQGIMGYYYASAQAESESVAKPLRELYLPRFAKDILPETLAGCALALADRFDFIVGIFSIGKAPTGEKDPFGLRRAVIGILRIIIDKKLELDLLELVEKSIGFYRKQLEKYDQIIEKNYQVPSEEQAKTIAELIDILKEKIMGFIFERLRSWYGEKNIPAHIFKAVKMHKPLITKPIDFDKRVFAVQRFHSLPEAQTLVIAHRRVNNILASAKIKSGIKFNSKLLTEGPERELAERIVATMEIIKTLRANNQYQEALTTLAKLKSSIDYFFDNVMVMDEDPKLRDNRLLLLQQLQALLSCVADISQLVISGEKE